MEQYSNYIKKLADSDSTDIFPNSGPSHAAVVMNNIFLKANNEIKMFAGDFCNEAAKSDLYRDGLEKYLEKSDSKIEIISEGFDFEKLLTNNSKLGFLFFKYSEKDKVKIHKSTQIDDKENHFAVADGKMFRFEKNKQSLEALGCFNDKEVSQKLNDKFNKLKINSIEVFN